MQNARTYPLVWPDVAGICLYLHPFLVVFIYVSQCPEVYNHLHRQASWVSVFERGKEYDVLLCINHTYSSSGDIVDEQTFKK